MERMTEYIDDSPGIDTRKLQFYCDVGGCIIGDIARRLAAYEDTGLEPEEIRSLRMDMAIIKAMFGDADVKRMKELCEADKEGLVVVLDTPRKPLVWGDDEHNSCLCPDCGEDLMGIPYGEYMILQCPVCGQYLDATKIITRAEAEAALGGGNQ